MSARSADLAAVSIPLTLLWVTVAILRRAVVISNQGHFVYALDDPYIHMAIAKHLVSHGVWGVTGDGFGSASSSLVWTSALALVYRIVGASAEAPFVMALLCATGLLVVAYLLLRQVGLPRVYTSMLLVVLIYLTPLPALVFTGQEHILHMLATILFVFLASEALGRDAKTIPKPAFWPVAALGLLLPAIRYESLALVSVACVFYAMRKRWRESAALGLASLALIGAFGVVSVKSGSFPLPNSVLLKSTAGKNIGTSVATADGSESSTRSSIAQNDGPRAIGAASEDGAENAGRSARVPVLLTTAKTALRRLPRTALKAPHFGGLIVLGLALFILPADRRRWMWEGNAIRLAMFLSVACLQFVTGKVGWFYRYEAYLMALGLMVVGTAAWQWTREQRTRGWNAADVTRCAVVGLILLAVATPLVRRATGAIRDVSVASHNIYEQQYQMGLFLQEYYQGQAVAANDIGAINYLAEIRCVDLQGLNDAAIAGKMMRAQWNTEAIDEVTKERQTRIAIIYEELFVGRIPPDWVKVAQWQIRNNRVCYSDIVTFYAVERSAKDGLLADLKAFKSRLPSDVKVRFFVAK